MYSKVIVWRVTQDCNMRCQFCSYSNDIKRVRDDANIEDAIKFIKLLTQYKNHSHENILVSLIGGEPFLYKNIHSFVKELSSNGIGVSATTNGLLIEKDEVLKLICSDFNEIVFSLDGFSDCHDRIRSSIGSFEKVVNNIKKLALMRENTNSKIKIKINTILLKENIEDFKNFCKFVSSIGVDEITFNQLGGYDRPEFYEDNRLSKSQTSEFILDFDNLKNEMKKNGLIVHGNKQYLNMILSSTQNEKIIIDKCDTGNWFWFINENGYISPCSYTSYEYKYSINDIKSIEDFNKLGEYFANLRESNRSKWCDDCHCTQMHDKFTE